MISIINENFYDMALISKIKEQTEAKKIKKIENNLKNIEKDGIKKLSGFKVKIVAEDNEAEKKIRLKTSSPIIELQHYIKDYKTSNSQIIVNNNNEPEEDNTLCTADNNKKELKQIENSDFSDDE